MKVVLDTHPIVFWLLEPKKLGKKARELLSNDSVTILIPTISILEIQYLIEIKRISAEISDFTAFIGNSVNVLFQDFDSQALFHSLKLSNTRDPFDRIILGTAMSLETQIITRDRWMRKEYKQTIW